MEFERKACTHLASIEGDFGREEILHVMSERDAMYFNDGLLCQKSLVIVPGMRRVRDSFVDRDIIVESQL